MMDLELADRLQKIESHLMHLEHAYEQLNQVVLQQGRELDKITSQQQRVSQTLEAMELERIKATNVKPPHYQ
jgi:uncharacterized coiled-coil protein SlyX